MSLLPKSRSSERYTLRDIRILIYGPPGIGKTTFFADWEDTLFICTENAHKNFKIFKINVETWKEFLDVVSEVLDGKHKYKMVVIDTADNLYKFCQDHVSVKNKFAHPSDLQYGKGWDLVKTEFQRPMLRLSASKFGLGFVSHSTEKEIKTKFTTVTKIMPTLSGQARAVIAPFVEIIGYCGFKSVKDGDSYIEKRMLYFEPSEYMDAKDRTGFLPPIMKLSSKKFREFFDDEKGGDE